MIGREADFDGQVVRPHDTKEERAGIRTKRVKQNEKPTREHLADFKQSLEDREISSAQ